LRQRYQEERQALQQQISASIRARDAALTKELRERQKELTADYNREVAKARDQVAGGVQNPRQGRAPRKAPSSRQPSASSDCPERILAWVNELESQGGSLQAFGGYRELANLFRPSAFIPHFGKTFAEMSEQEVRDLGTAIQLSCASGDSALARGGLRIPLAQLLNRPTRWGTTEMGIAGMALEVAGDWSERMRTILNTEADYPTIQAFEYETIILLRTLWPAERDPLVEAIPLGKSNAVERFIVSTIQGYSDRMEQADPEETFTQLYNIAKIRYQNLFDKILPSEQERVGKRYIEMSLDAIEAMKSRFKRDLEAMPDARGRNEYTLEWWGWAYNAALKFYGDHLETESFENWIGQQREKDWRALKPEILQEIDANDSLIYARTFMPSISLYAIDEAHCPTWQEIREHQAARLEVLEREAFVARVGEGPFGVDHPGAIYLNAIYRLDREQIARENRLLTDPMNDYFTRKRDNVLEQIFENKMREYLQGNLTGTNFVDPLLAYFAGAYQFHYPDCIENPVRITDTTYYEVISKDGASERGIADVTVFTVNGRHAPAFRKMGERPFSPENRDFVMNLFDPIVPQDVRDNAALLNEAVTGMKLAMQERSCDDPVIRQLDKNLMILFSEN